jgi:hypothetical protein
VRGAHLRVRPSPFFVVVFVFVIGTEQAYKSVQRKRNHVSENDQLQIHLNQDS